ncbi:MAG: alpha/beta fold hydrolase [Candidatus Heimdallarchaeota archaeon]|nr:alpha/beta fold hydrolase [Candidatus Heimdallarchaeota archaeon]
MTYKKQEETNKSSNKVTNQGEKPRKPIMKGAEPFFYRKGSVGCLLCHGFTGSPKEVRGMGEYLAERNITILAPLLPGHGTTVKDMTQTTKKDWYTAYLKAYEQLQEICQEIFIAGLSMGGVLALKFAEEFEPEGVIVMATPVRMKFPENILLAIFAPLKWLTLPKKEEELEDYPKLDLVSYDRNPIAPANSLRKLMNEVRKKLGKITEPIIIFQGLEDEPWIIRSAKTIYDTVSSQTKKLVYLEQSPHCLTVGPEKNQVWEQVYQFIRNHSTIL